MKVTYDASVDVLRILFSDAPIAESDEDKPGCSWTTPKMAAWLAWKFWTLPSDRAQLSCEFCNQPQEQKRVVVARAVNTVSLT
jgi:hypothetical protein